MDSSQTQDTEDDVHKILNLMEKVEELESENNKIRDEFNVQRAKMKDLFLQKEEEFNKEKSRLNSEIQKLTDELNDAQSQVTIAGLRMETDLEDEKRKAHEEISSLQQLVRETVEETSSAQSIHEAELRRLQQTITLLESENSNLKSIGQQSSPHHSSQEQNALAPSVMLSAVTKTIVRKLGADTFSSQESLEESMRKAQEEADLMRTLVLPLEEEIKALKDKLRSTDDQLQKCLICGHLDQDGAFKPPEDINALNADEHNTDSVKPESPPPCVMCSNYETQLVREQQCNSELTSRLAAAEKAMERHKEDLLKEIGFRKDMEEKWNEKKEEHKKQVQELNTRTLCAEQDLQELKLKFDRTYTEVMKNLGLLTREREQVDSRLISLQKENEYLVGKHSEHSRALQNETINLPDTVEELQEKLLKLQEDLIIAKVAKEVAQEQERTLQGDIVLLREQIMQRESIESDLVKQVDQLNMQSQHHEKERQQLNALHEKLKNCDKTYHDQVASLSVQLSEISKQAKHLEESNGELRSKVTSLQQELNNSEAVQKDFVRLSQSLQVQLEKIRASDTQVRWQHEDDVEECPSCRSGFSSAKKKQHCLHCGQIFCAPCLSHSVKSGPKHRPVKVCDVCHTLLVKSSAPYFSTEPPHSTD